MLLAPRFQNLDKLRGFAALSVLLYHVIEHTHWSAFPREGPLYWGRIGWMGVDLFFVLSGLVITHSAWGLFHTQGARWQQIYWARRTARIVPLYCLTLGIYMTFVTPEWLSVNLVKLLWHTGTHLLFIHNIFPGTHGSINGVNWSVGVEMQFYLLIALTLHWLVRAHLATLALGSLCVAWVWRSVAFLLLQDQGTNLLFQYSTQLPGSIDEFVIGVMLCKLLVDPRYMRLLHLLECNRKIIFMFSTVCCTAMLWVYINNANYWDSWWMVAIFRSLIGLSAGSVVLSAVFCPWMGPAIISNVLDYLGKISYGIYLWHLPVILSLLRSGAQAGWSFLLTTVITTLVLASASYHLFEDLWVRHVRRNESSQIPGHSL